MARANGEGSITRRKNGTYQGSWFETINGQRKRRYVYGKTSKEVRDKVRDALNRIERGLPGIDSTDTFRQVAETWRRTTMHTSGLSSKSAGAYVDVLKLHVYPVIGNERLRDIKPSQVSSVMVKMQDAGYSKSYQHQAHKAMSAVFRAAMADGLIASNPTKAVKAPRGGHKPTVVPDRGQVLRMIDEAPDERMKAFVAVLAYTGCRISEALSIRWSDVNNERIVIRHGKGDKTRAVPVPARLSEVLKAWRKAQAQERLKAVWWDESDDWMLSTDVGTQWDPHNARKRFKPIADGDPENEDPSKRRPAICRGATPHSLRHATATLLLEEGVPMKVVAELLGHSSTRITEETYSHVTARLVQEAGDAIGRALG